MSIVIFIADAELFLFDLNATKLMSFVCEGPKNPFFIAAVMWKLKPTGGQ